jgi:hypothetical protein
MGQTSRVPKPRKRLTQAEALERARAQLKEAEARSKPKRVADEDDSGQRDRDRWVTLPRRLGEYVGEQAVISQGWLWTHRIDRLHATTDSQGTKHIPVRPVCLGPTDVLDPNYKPKNKGLGQSTVEGDKTLGFMLGSEATCTNSHLSENEGFLSPPWTGSGQALGGRPKKGSHDALIMRLAGEGLGCKGIARTLNRDGIEISYRTIARRLSEFRH